ncbi:insulin gene enhancer protein ISL-2-like [Sphaerodactylus townsendi]|uniref:insulin gene enhancer protein ISL-2-like n=1 Tax=Sphaerodactylus townsendi TaxID=933632 RepID=UPI00202696E7|nr:insulin gene enhancer protein ISL-2-like [Sphaerodactylus townsendi]
MVDIIFSHPFLGAMGDHSKKKPGIAMCVGCGSEIHDQYILKVSPDLEWHAACLKCADCSQYLDENCTCFVRDGKTYCKRDYIRLFGVKCAKCAAGFSSSDLVMRARAHVYHLECFRCSVCSRQLLPGDEFSLRDHELLCRADHGLLLDQAAAADSPPRSPGHLPAARQGLSLAGRSRGRRQGRAGKGRARPRGASTDGRRRQTRTTGAAPAGRSPLPRHPPLFRLWEVFSEGPPERQKCWRRRRGSPQAADSEVNMSGGLTSR